MKHFTLFTAFLALSFFGYAQFNLVSPANNALLKSEGLGSSPVSINWTSQNTLMGNVAYTWHLDSLSGNFSSPIVSVPANNMGADTMLTLDFTTVNAVLAGAGVQIGDTAALKWTVTASNGTSTIFSTSTGTSTIFSTITSLGLRSNSSKALSNRCRAI